MGGSSKKVTVGYRYYLGIHMILCHGPIDRLRKILVDDKTAWRGDYAGGRINVRADNLFGGESREGGVSGAVDIEMGGPSQGVNDYLAGQLGSDIPAFRGVVGAVLRQCYLGINPYLKKWAFLAQRIHTRQNGLAQWYDSKSEIGSLWAQPQAVYIALDSSGSMREVMSNGLTRLANAKASVLALLDYIAELQSYSNVQVDVMVVLWGGLVGDFTYRASMTRRTVDAAAINELKTWLAATDIVMGTYFPSATADSSAFFAGSPASANRTSLFITDGEPSIPDQPTAGTPEAIAAATAAGEELLSVARLQAFAFNLDLDETAQTAKLDNTSADGVPVLEGDDPSALLSALVSSLTGQRDMNPAHIIRECLTDPDWGMGYQEADVDDVSFTAAADTLFSEGFGLSLIWDRQTPIEDFVREVVRHIQASLYVDRTTGKFVLKLIRADYDVEDLLLLDESNVEKVDNFSRPSFGDMVNSVTVNYWDSETYKTASISAQDTALIQMQGAVIGTTIQYPGCTGRLLASKLATRDLRTLSAPLLSCTVYANRQAASLNVGDPFLLYWPDYMDAPTVMRVIGLALGDGRTNKVKVTCTEDAFAFPEVPMVVPEVPTWEDPNQEPTAAAYRAVVEAPYYELVQRMGQTTADEQLAANPDIGYLLASAAAPAGAINARLAVDAGAGYDGNDTPMDFCPVAFLAQDVRPGDVELAITDGSSLSAAAAGTHVQIDDELMMVVSVTASLLTVGRGVLDTVPAAHSAGAVALFWDAFADSDGVEYVAGETVSAKVLPVSGSGPLPLSQAPVDILTFVSRALRPYPPGKLLIGGESYPEAIAGTAGLSLSWAHRDRLQQTAGELQDTTVGDIGPEAGTTYNLRIYGESGELIRSVLGVTLTAYDYADELTDSELVYEAGASIQPILLHADGANAGTVFTNNGNSSPAAVTAFGGAVTDTSQSKFGTASAKFNGTSAYLETAGVLHLYLAFCVQFFVRPTDVREECYFSQYESGNNGRFTIYTNASGKLEVFLGSITNLQITTAISLPLNQWSHIAVCRDFSNVIRVFVDGILAGSGSSAQMVLNTPIRISADGSAGKLGLRRFSNAYIDEVLVTLNSPVYTSNFTVPSSAFPNPGDVVYRLNGRVRVELESERDSMLSLQKHDYTVLREGYGFNYGELYGGT